MSRVITSLVSGLALLAFSFPALATDSDNNIAEARDVAEARNIAEARDITGVWTSEELGFELEIYDCGAANLCGRVVSYSKTTDYVDVPMPPPQEEVTGDQRIVGRELLSGFEADLENGAKWNNGRIFNPKNGRTYKSTLTLADEDTLKLRAYVGIPIFGRNLTLRRVPQYSPAGGG